MKVLSLQPFFGGSHQQFHEGWVRHSKHDWTTITLPSRHWKWRMRHAAIHFASEVGERHHQGQRWDAVVCTDMMNVAEFRGLAPMIGQLPLVLYFHENQFTYPDRFQQDRDQHFAFTNFVSSVAADQIWFNSAFNRDSMQTALVDQAKRWPDFVPKEAIQSLKTKASVHHPGIDLPVLDWQSIEQARRQRVASGQPLHLIWAARWEHDKNPADLLNALRRLRDHGVPFQLSVIGERFRIAPSEFETIRTEFADVVQCWGYQSDRASYWQALCNADVFLSTATHEFFGLAAAEAIAAGAYPLLPDRLAYPELLQSADVPESEACLYGQTPDDLASHIEQLHQHRDWIVSEKLSSAFRDRLSWANRAKEMDAALSLC